MGFTVKQIENLKPQEKPYQVREGKGFGVRVYPSGERVWFFAYKFNDRQRMMSIGPYPEIRLAEARAIFEQARRQLKKGIDPLAEKEADRQAATVAAFVDEFIEKGLKLKGNRSWPEYERNLRKDVIPAWGKIKMQEITRRDVMVLQERILERGSPNQSNQVFKIVRRMFNFAVERGVVETSPCLNVKFLAPEKRKDRFLSDEEIRVFWQALDSCPISEDISRALRLVLVTAQRPGEVIGAHVSEFDGDWWTIPADRSKNKRSHRVYLTELARDLFQLGARNDYLFPSPRPTATARGPQNKPIAVNALAHALRRAFEKDQKTGAPPLPLNHFTPHDLRRTAASHMASLGFGVIVDKVLNHTDPRVTAIYDRYSYDKEKRQALEAWERKILKIVGAPVAAKVINLPR